MPSKPHRSHSKSGSSPSFAGEYYDPPKPASYDPVPPPPPPAPPAPAPAPAQAQAASPAPAAPSRPRMFSYFQHENPLNVGSNSKPFKNGGSTLESYGSLLYEIEEIPTQGRCDCEKTQLKVRFYESIILFENDDTFCCYAAAFKMRAIPKYLIKHIEIERAQVSKCLFWTMVTSLIIGIILIIVGSRNSTDASSEYYGIGAALIIVAVIGLLYPCCNKKYTITIKLNDEQEEKKKGGGCFTGIRCPQVQLCGHAEKSSLVFTVREEPDKDFLMSYCYGVLNSDVSILHRLNHLIGDSLSHSLSPASVDNLVHSA